MRKTAIWGIFVVLMAILSVFIIGCGDTNVQPDATQPPASDNATTEAPAVETTDQDPKTGTAGILASAAVGDIIHLGTISFTDAFGNEFSDDIGWLVLAKEDGHVLVITQDVIDYRHFNQGFVDITWEQCSVRQWLNSDFYNGLASEMRQLVQVTNVINNDNLEFGTPGGNDTQDYVFLLSVDEAEDFFVSDKDRRADAILTQGTIELLNPDYENGIVEYLQKRGGNPWMLRSPGFDPRVTAGVDYDGRIVSAGGDPYYLDHMGVRPAVWLGN